MTNNDGELRQTNNFLAHFLMGAVFGASALFFLGTTKGRQILRKSLEVSEDLEKSIEKIIKESAGKIEEDEEKDNRFIQILEKIKSIFSSKKEDNFLLKPKKTSK